MNQFARLESEGSFTHAGLKSAKAFLTVSQKKKGTTETNHL
jgi:hypothetical protein